MTRLARRDGRGYKSGEKNDSPEKGEHLETQRERAGGRGTNETAAISAEQCLRKLQCIAPGAGGGRQRRAGKRRNRGSTADGTVPGTPIWGWAGGVSGGYHAPSTLGGLRRVPGAGRRQGPAFLLRRERGRVLAAFQLLNGTEILATHWQLLFPRLPQ
ncbi:hypothetical protein FB451DRAFT_1173426 [Mycena latifolia]|nr:hypothetical protein FB451DRAFT_1173426 [Mycena latifolia]